MSVVLHKRNAIIYYLEVLKPRETVLLTFIGLCTAIYATSGFQDYARFLILLVALFSGNAGCNGLTNYLDREVDAKMERTKNRVLPRRLIYPPNRVLPLIISLIIFGVILAGILNPLCAIVGIIGVIASSIWRKTVSCTFLGIIAGCCPVLIGWFAFSNDFNLDILLLCLLIVFWIPIHVWSVMLSKADDYKNAGLNYFPLNVNKKIVIEILLVLSFLLFGVSLAIFFFLGLSTYYLILTTIMGISIIVLATILLIRFDEDLSWRLYKLSSFPYLGIIFFAIALNKLLF